MNQFMNNQAVNPQAMQFQNQRSFPTTNYPSSSAFNNIVWVQGIEGAKAFQLPPSSRAHLMDSENEGIFYIKTSDEIGMCNLRIFDYTERTSAPASASSADLSEYVRKDELKELIKGVIGNEQSIPAAKSKSSRNVIAE